MRALNTNQSAALRSECACDRVAVAYASDAQFGA